MIAPAVMFIEMGAARLKDVPGWLAEAQRKELASFGDYRAQQAGASGMTVDFQRGYELGLATFRAVCAGNPVAVKAGLDI